MDRRSDPLTVAYHELRSPLGLIVMQARAAAAEATEPGVRARCESIVRAAERMLRTAAEIFAAEQAAGSTVERTFAPVEVASGLITDLQGLSFGVMSAACLALVTIPLSQKLNIKGHQDF